MSDFGDISTRKGILNGPCFDLLCYDPKDRNNLDHDLNDDLRHARRRSDGNIFFKPHKKIFHAVEQVDNSILGSADVLNGLRGTYVTKTSTHDQGRYSLGVGLRFR
jgi:hypothetical protein